jgi:cardiolipin synthase A/B
LSPLTLFGVFGVGRDNKRNHRRMLVVDGQIGLTGGSGVNPKWMGDGRTDGHWRDTDVRIEGPIVSRISGAFVENWLEATGNVLGGDAYFPTLTGCGSVSAQIVRSSPEGEASRCTRCSCSPCPRRGGRFKSPILISSPTRE